jgi:hypothetical protein
MDQRAGIPVADRRREFSKKSGASVASGKIVT